MAVKQWHHETQPVSLDLCTAIDLTAWANAPNLSAASRRSRLSSLRSFWGWCRDEGHTARNPANLVRTRLDGLSHIQKEGRHRQPFTVDEFNTLMGILYDEPDGHFWQTAMHIAWNTGLRLGDIACMEWNCIQGNRLVVWTDKTDKRVELELPENLCQILKSHRHGQGGRYLFPAQQALASEPARAAALSVRFGRLCRKVRISGKSFHCLRHAYATRRAQETDLESVRVELGHSHTSTTLRYIHPQNL